MLFILDKTAMKHLRRNLKLVIPLFAVKLSPEWYPKADFDICASVIHACHVCVRALESIMLVNNRELVK